MESLPTDIIVYLNSFIGPYESFRFLSTCKKFHNLIKEKDQLRRKIAKLSEYKSDDVGLLTLACRERDFSLFKNKAGILTRYIRYRNLKYITRYFYSWNYEPALSILRGMDYDSIRTYMLIGYYQGGHLIEFNKHIQEIHISALLISKLTKLGDVKIIQDVLKIYIRQHGDIHYSHNGDSSSDCDELKTYSQEILESASKSKNMVMIWFWIAFYEKLFDRFTTSEPHITWYMHYPYFQRKRDLDLEGIKEVLSYCETDFIKIQQKVLREDIHANLVTPTTLEKWMKILALLDDEYHKRTGITFEDTSIQCNKRQKTK